jgi:hypothetical protein
VVSNAARLTVWTLNTVRNMIARNLLDIDDSFFEEAVTITTTNYRREVQVSIGEKGTIAPKLGEPYGDGWQQPSPPGLPNKEA